MGKRQKIRGQNLKKSQQVVKKKVVGAKQETTRGAMGERKQRGGEQNTIFLAGEQKRDIDRGVPRKGQRTGDK